MSEVNTRQLEKNPTKTRYSRFRRTRRDEKIRLVARNARVGGRYAKVLVQARSVVPSDDVMHCESRNNVRRGCSHRAAPIRCGRNESCAPVIGWLVIRL
jgi:hypothetical protein